MRRDKKCFAVDACTRRASVQFPHRFPIRSIEVIIFYPWHFDTVACFQTEGKKNWGNPKSDIHNKLLIVAMSNA